MQAATQAERDRERERETKPRLGFLQVRRASCRGHFSALPALVGLQAVSSDSTGCPTINACLQRVQAGPLPEHRLPAVFKNIII